MKARIHWRSPVVSSLLVLWSVAAILALPSEAAFTDVATTAGLNVAIGLETVVDPGAGIDLGTSGNPICAADLDGDGLTDLLVAQNGRRVRFFRNLGNGTFSEEAVARGLGGVYDIAGIAAGDLSNKGSRDVVMVPRYGNRYYLFINDGTGHFTEKAVERGADMTVTLQFHKGQSVSLVDYDLDGYLDIHVGEWGVPSSTENDKHAVLLHNKGKAAPGFFENATASSGLLQPRFGTISESFVSAWADFDRDGYPDLYLTSDYGTSQMWWNNGNGTFTETRIQSRVGTEGNGMGLAVADVNHDGLPDIFVSSFDNRTGNLIASNRLYLNKGGRVFQNIATGTPIEDTSWPWGSAFLDANNDTHLDLMVTNGYKYYSPFQQSPLGGVILNANTDSTKFFLGTDSIAGFADYSTLWGVKDNLLGRGLAVLDFNNDGWEDVLISNVDERWILYRNDHTGNANHWLRFTFQGTTSNRDGYGAEVSVTAGGITQLGIYAPTNAYIGQREPVLHFGLGSSATATTVKVRWPSGAEQTFANVAADAVVPLVEPVVDNTMAPVFTLQPVGGAQVYGAEVFLTAEATGTPAPSYTWYKDGVVIAGSFGPSYHLKSLHPYDAGNYTVVAKNTAGTVTSSTATLTVTADLSTRSVARWWDEEILEAIRHDTPNPPVHARNLYHLSCALWDAFWAYEPDNGTIARAQATESPSLPGTESERIAAQKQALSNAAYRVISKRYAKSPGAARTLSDIRWLMLQYGFNPDDTGTTGDGPAAVGNRIGNAVLAATLYDGANEENGYADATGYASLNASMIPSLPGTTMVDPNHWQPLSLSYSISQNGLVQPGGAQKFVGVNARLTVPFALAKPTPETLALDPGPPPQLGGDRSEVVQADVIDVLAKSSTLDASDGALVDISPAAILRNPLGTNAGTGRAVNPVTQQPYATNVVKRGDYARVLAEFWADGPNSETPPGHWNVLFNEVSDHPLCEHRYGGTGEVLPRLEWDVRGYFALNGSLHDAACAAWTLKRQYDGVRPISLIRYMAGKGQSSDPAKPNFNADGLPLVPNLIEQTTAESLSPGGRHAEIVQRTSVVADLVGKIVVHAWRGNPLDPLNDSGGVGWILAESWVPYQKSTFVTPAFPGYISGHSTFSRTAAEVLTLVTGSPFFPGGVSSRTFSKNHFLEFEAGPSADLTLQWATYYDAADQAGLSRLFGGIHPSTDDLTGRRLGSRLGLEGFLKAQVMRAPVENVGGLRNLSARGLCGADRKALILGFYSDASDKASLLVRAVGPTLELFGIEHTRCAPDPNLEVFSMAEIKQSLAVNDQWGSGADKASVLQLTSEGGAFSLPDGSADAAAVVQGGAGGYTVVTRPGTVNTDKVELVEVYGPKVMNGSARGYVGTGADVLIVGFSVVGKDPAPVLLRGTGPTLGVFNVAGVLADPEIRLHRISPDGKTITEVGYNDSWPDGEKESLVQSASARVGAFGLADAHEACLFVQLEPGNYTVTLSGVNGGTGVGLLEVYYVK